MEPNTEQEQGPRQSWARRMFFPLLVMFRQGTDPSRMAESVALGTFLGILPLPGLNSVLCAIVAVRRGLNMCAIQAINWIMLPAQICLFLPMSRQGASALGHQPLPLGVDDIHALLKAGPVAFFKAVGVGFLDATLAWCVIGIPACWLLFRATRHILERRVSRAPVVK